MILYDVYKTPHEILDIVWEGQRQYLRDQGVHVHSINLSGVPAREVPERLRALKQPDAWLLRGLEFLNYDPPGVVYVDLATPCELGTTTPYRTKLQKVRRVLCYSVHMANSVRDAGLGRISVFPGPHMETLETEYPAKPTVAVLRTCSDAQRVLTEIMAFRATKDFTFDVVSPMMARGATHVGTNLDAAMAATLVLAPTDFGELGDPHLGAILALGVRKALATSRNDAIGTMGIPAGSFIHVTKYSPRSYIGAIELFMRNPRPFMEWPLKASTDYTRVPRFLITDLTTLNLKKAK